LASVSLVPRFQAPVSATCDGPRESFAHHEQLDFGAAGSVMASTWVLAARGSGSRCLCSANKCVVGMHRWRIRRNCARRPCWCWCRTRLLLSESEAISLRGFPRSQKRSGKSLLSYLQACCHRYYEYWSRRRMPASATVWVIGEDATLSCVAQTGHADGDGVHVRSLALCACLRNFFLRSGRAGSGCAPGKGGRRRKTLATSGEQ
jgi:hypothetical protein